MISIAEIIIISILIVCICSVIGSMILWICGRGIAEVKRANFFNSWGLWWILFVANGLLSLLLAVIFFTILFEPSNLNAFVAGLITLTVFYNIVSVLITLAITKAFWKCTWYQSFLSHFVPIVIYFLTQIIGWIIFIPRLYYF